MISLRTEIKIMQVFIFLLYFIAGFLFHRRYYMYAVSMQYIYALSQAINMKRKKTDKKNSPRAKYVRLKELFNQGITIKFSLNYMQ